MYIWKKEKQIWMFEGLDGSGKGTAIENLLANLPYWLPFDNVLHRREPGGGKLGEMCRKALIQNARRGAYIGRLEEYLYFWTGRFDLWRDICDWFSLEGNESGNVFLDRSFASTYAYQIFARNAPSYLRETFREMVLELLQLLAKIHPDVEIHHVYLKVRPEVAASRICVRGKVDNDITQFNDMLTLVSRGYDEFYQNVRSGHYDVAGVRQTVNIIDAGQDQLSVSQQIMQAFYSHNPVHRSLILPA